MKRRLTISITFGLVVLATLAALGQSGHGQPENNVRQSRLNSGLIPLNQNEFVRLSLANATMNPDASDRRTVRVNVRVLHYAPSGQQGPVTEYMVVGQTSSGPITLSPGGGASMDFDLTQAVSPNVQALFVIVEALPLAGSSNNARASACLTKYDKLANQPLSVWVWVESESSYVWM